MKTEKNMGKGGLRLKRIIAAVFAVMTLALAGCVKEPGKPAQSPVEKKPLVVGLMPDIDSVPFIVAREMGFFDAEGVDVRLMQFKSAMERDAALQSGNLDGAVSDMLAVVFARSGGFDVVMTSSTDGRYALVASESSMVTGAAGLVGGEVAISKNTIIEYVTDKILERARVSPDDISKVTVGQIPARLELLRNGKIAAATLPEPMAAIAVGDGCRYIESSDELSINPGVMVFSSKSADVKKDEIKAMYRAYNRSIDYLTQKPRREYIDFVVEGSGFPKGAKETLRLPRYRKASPASEKDFSEVVSWMSEKKLTGERYSYKDLAATGLLP